MAAVSSHAIIEIYAALLGLIVGSYLNVVIHRLPRGQSTLTPRSRCPRCRAAIRPWDNIPVLSFLLLRARCRHCAARISWRYPLVEIATGLAFWASFREFPAGFSAALIAAGFSAAMIALAMIDVEHYLLPDRITLSGVAFGLLILPFLGWLPARDIWLGAFLGAGILGAVAWGWYWWKGVVGMGLGDVKMLAMIGAFLGWKGVVSTLFMASLGGSLVGIALMLMGRLKWQSRLPFGVFLACGAVATLFFHAELIGGYQSFSRAVGRWML